MRDNDEKDEAKQTIQKEEIETCQRQRSREGIQAEMYR